MAYLYPSSINQRDDITPNLYLKDPNQIIYPESSVQSNMLHLNFSSSDPYSDSSAITSQEYYASQFGDNNYNAKLDGRDEILLMHSVERTTNAAEDFAQSGISVGHKLSLEQPKGLSLSLGTQVSLLLGTCNSFQTDNANSSSCGIPNYMTSVPNSKYLKAAQQLLVEIVNVRDALKQKRDESQRITGSKDIDRGSKDDAVPLNPQESTSDLLNEVSTTERQYLQNKLTKLLAMLNEVDRRYKQFYNQMYIVASSFDAVTKPGSANAYTALALQTISRHFRCVRDAVTSQITKTQKNLGEQDGSSEKAIGISRLRYIDQKIRQQRAMQNFGMMQPHTWRPQRGLPENSVSILRAWLFEHFLHPYPKDSEKLMLARQTGLTRGQVANWFINARVRLWKPMIEEMHKEEFNGNDVDSNSSLKKQPKIQKEMKEKSEGDRENSESNFISDVDNTSMDDAYMNLKLREQMPNGENCGLRYGTERLLAYQMAETSGYANGVSLTLGLSDIHRKFIVARGEEIYGSDAPLGQEDFEFIEPPYLMHEFVA